MKKLLKLIIYIALGLLALYLTLQLANISPLYRSIIGLSAGLLAIYFTLVMESKTNV